ncbi:VirB8/TrbF family protein [Sphingomonas sp. ST-64]|uniref:VirB8/TrbF family protein n=1 Tax=Sphingomonas plantiphila TaxID=3163295 RepID=A0ABW8YLK8_9SPHN
MKEEPRAQRDAYYREAASWAQDRHDSLRRSRRIAWIVAGAAATIAVLEAFALMLLTPLKTVEPYTLLVDKQTGYVQAVKPLEPAQVSGDAALTQSFLVQYVIARESFDIDALQANYRKVALWSADSARSRYVASMQASFADSPLNRYPRSTVVETNVKSVSPMGLGAAMVRFETRRTDQGGQARVIGSWVAVVRYRYSGEPMRVEDRYLNPLGFQVLRYRRDPEAIPQTEPTSSPPAPAQSAPSGASTPAQ